MFTGIIKYQGKIISIANYKDGKIFKIKSFEKDIAVSESIALNGVCLTVMKKSGNYIHLYASDYTLNITGLKTLKTGNFVNVERALKLNDFVGGHLVSGHIDCVGTVKKIIRKTGYYNVELEILEKFLIYIVEKGSIAVDGISLTIAARQKNGCMLMVVPYTFENTILKYKKKGDKVNIEFDIIIKTIVNNLDIYKTKK